MERLTQPILRRWMPKAAQPWLDRLEASSLGQRLAKGVFWSAIGAVSSRGLTLLASVVTARIVGKAPFGQLGIIQSTALMFGSFASFGMGLTAIKFIAQCRTADPARAGRIIAMSSLISWVAGILMAAIVAVLAPWLATRTLAAPELANYLRFGAMCVLCNVVSDAQVGILSGLEAFRSRSYVQFLSAACSFPVTVSCVYFAGLEGAVWALVFSQVIVVVLNVLAIRREARAVCVPIAWQLSIEELKVLWEFSLPTLLAGLVYVPAIWLANAFIVNQPNGYAEMGIFSAADRWRTAIVFLPSLLAGVALPMLANLRMNSVRERYERVLWTNVRLSCVMSLIACVPIGIAARWIMRAYGTGFASGSWILVGLCVVAVISATAWILIQSVISAGRMWLVLGVNVAWALLLTGTAWLLRRHGAAALVLAYILAESARLVLVAMLARSNAVLGDMNNANAERNLTGLAAPVES